MNQDEQLLNGLKQAVLDNLENEQFNVEHLSDIVGVSRSHLHRRLKKLKGQSISQFIREIRLAEALKLLRQDVATNSEIAYRVGFNSPSYFHKCFHEYYGYTPSEAKHRFQNHTVNEDAEGETVAAPSTVSKSEKKQSSDKFKTIVFSIIALFFIAYSAFYFLKKDIVSAPVEKSIAVLPFNSLSEDEGNQYFADGLVEDLLNRLAMVEEFKVISRTSSNTYRDQRDKKIPEIAAELGVAYIVEGSVQKHDNKARITVQLIDAKNDDHVWTESYDRDLADVFKIQSEITMHVFSALSTVLTEKQVIDIQKNRTENVKAFELYQLGRHHWEQRTLNGLRTSITYFEQAIAEDSIYALAYAGLADSYFLLSIRTKKNKENSDKGKALELARKALEMDGRLAEAYTVLASIYYYSDWDWAAAGKAFEKAFELNSNYPHLHQRYSEYLSLIGRHEEARKHINKAIELDPLSFAIRTISANLYFNRGQFKETLAEAQICKQMYFNSIVEPWFNFVICYKLGDGPAMVKWLKKLKHIKKDTVALNQVDSVYEASGLDGLLRWETELADWDLAKADYYGLLGEYDKALDWLEADLEDGSYMTDVPYWYSLRELHSNPRFIAILNKMNLPWEPDPSQ